MDNMFAIPIGYMGFACVRDFGKKNQSALTAKYAMSVLVIFIAAMYFLFGWKYSSGLLIGLIIGSVVGKYVSIRDAKRIPVTAEVDTELDVTKCDLKSKGDS